MGNNKGYKTPKAPWVKIAVTDEMIDDAIPRHSGHCVFAEAVKAAFPDARKVAVDVQTIRFSDPKKGFRYAYLTPRTCQVAIIQFDQGIRPIPFDFTLRNGQVTAMQQHTAKPISEKARQANAKNVKKAQEVRKRNAKIRKASLVTRSERNNSRSSRRQTSTCGYRSTQSIDTRNESWLARPDLDLSLEQVYNDCSRVRRRWLSEHAEH